MTTLNVTSTVNKKGHYFTVGIWSSSTETVGKKVKVINLSLSIQLSGITCILVSWIPSLWDNVSRSHALGYGFLSNSTSSSWSWRLVYFARCRRCRRINELSSSDTESPSVAAASVESWVLSLDFIDLSTEKKKLKLNRETAEFGIFLFESKHGHCFFLSFVIIRLHWMPIVHPYCDLLQSKWT